MNTEAAFATVSGRFIEQHPQVEQARMLRSTGLRVEGRFFAFARDDELVLKLPAARVTMLVGDGRREPFASGGRTTPIVSGTTAIGGEITFGFDGLDETIVMRVDESRPAEEVRWICLEHGGHPEWEGTAIVFELAERGADGCLLRFRHEGLVPELDCYLACEGGWEHFLPSLADYAETGHGSPFR